MNKVIFKHTKNYTIFQYKEQRNLISCSCPISKGAFVDYGSL